MSPAGNLTNLRKNTIMNKMLKRTGRTTAIIGLAAASFLPLSCTQKASDADKASEKRWANFQKDNKRGMAVGASAFEKRQAQLAEKKRKEAEKAGATPGANAPTVAPKDKKN